ncbi:MAG TPA: hypothetical protein VF054_09700 [Micromonosporaceae bacterium]
MTGPDALPGTGRPGRTRRLVTRHPVWMVAVVLAAALLIAGGLRLARGAPRSSTFTASGKVALGDALSIQTLAGDQCQGKGAYSDIVEGAQVVVADPAGTVLATGHLSRGTLFGASCMFTFTVTVPTGRSSYGVSVAGQRGTRFTQAEMRRGVQVSLGL